MSWKSLKTVRRIPQSPARRVANAGVAEAIVARALLAVRQYGVGFAAFLEALFGLGIVGIAVRMELQRQLAIGALDLLIVGGTRDTQNFVIVTFHCGGQNSTSLPQGLKPR